MTEIWKPPQLQTIAIYLMWQSDPLVWDLSFNDYINLMRNIKTKAFVTLGNVSINKMHIMKIETEIPPHVAMSVNNFIHEQKEKAFDTWLSREELYHNRCISLPKRHSENREFTLNERKDGK